MPRHLLVIDGDNCPGLVIRVDNGALTVGDSEHGDLVFANARVVGIHCELEIGDSVPTRDGHALDPAATVALGQTNIRLVVLPDPPPAPAQAVVPSDRSPRLVTPKSNAAPPVLSKRLLVVDGADRGRSFLLNGSGITTIGKSAKHADIVLHDLYVARVHCELEVDGSRVVVRHREGQSGTLINGRSVIEQELLLGDVIRVGNSHLRYEIGEAVPPSTGETIDELPAIRLPESSPFGSPSSKAGTMGHSGPGSHADPASTSVDSLIELEGQVLGNYQFGALLGRGLFGLVFRAHHRETNQPVAIKVLSPDFPHGDAELQQFVKALKVVAPLRHPHLLSVYAAGKTGPYCWIAREHVEGESLAALISRLTSEGKLGWKRACRVAVHIGMVLDYLHQYRVWHGNITPSNILIQAETKAAKLGDLMLDRALAGSLLQKSIEEKRVLAELPYRAPEQLEAPATADHRASLYALGTVIYALLTGKAPFTGISSSEIMAQLREGRLVKPSRFLRDTPAPFEAAVLKLLARNPDDRFQTAGDLLATIEPIANMHEIKI